MEQRNLGNSALKVSSLCLGGNVFGWTADQLTSFRILDEFIDLGFNFIDTADVYSKWAPGNKGGDSETIIGQWLKQNNKRSQIVLTTKGGSEMGPGQKGLSSAYITKAVEASLSRLQTDYIDLYLSHFDDTTTPVEETLEAYAKLISAGKIRVIGASNFSPERLKEALQASEKGLPKYENYQMQYNLVEREAYEKQYASITEQYHVGVTTYFSLASGFLTGKYRSEKDLSKSTRGEGIKKYLNEKGIDVLTSLDNVSTRHNATPAQVALAWLIAQPGITAPVVSATSLYQLNDIAKAASLHLSAEEIAELNEASA
ncbi:Oxidoreductase [Arcticibacter svalbardensis MN12-7]|uniref:Oxidoreductase n=1 Tax=Arcticibacter svalbardensis MN12-7 TaxID=1150600 RepID=R9GR86_9SPHI|nr:aldo/keto reductase [Arcticibacter svalbardensis]EOR94193.1 Oxidoreductase [Arcticibacter svalbardensis MN12-7]